MASTSGVDPITLGIVSNIIITLVLASPLLFIFFRARSRPNSFTWKAVYVPRTWWPPDPAKRLHKTFDALPTHSFPKLLFLLLKGSPPRLIHPNETSGTSHHDIPADILTDEEIHLRFLALCLRLTFLALLLTLPIFLTLFSHDIPLTPDFISSSSLENFTVLRLLYHYDLTPITLSTRFLVWAVVALLLGSVAAFLIILTEWSFLKRHIYRFSRERCGELQIVYLPSDHRRGFYDVGEKKMVDWIRACGLGPDGAEGDGKALKAFKRQTSSNPSSSRRTLLPQAANKLRLGSGAQSQGEYTNLGKTECGGSPMSNAPSQTSLEREIVIQGVFTVSRLDHLYQLAEKRKKVLHELELDEAKYVAGFLPQSDIEGGPRSRSRSRSQRRHMNKNGRVSNEGEVTPYGPLGLYKIDIDPPDMDWETPMIRMTSLGFPSQSGALTDDSHGTKKALAKLPRELPNAKPQKVGSSTSKPPMTAAFGEILLDPQMPNDGYQRKWAIGNEVAKLASGTLQSIPPINNRVHSHAELVLPTLDSLQSPAQPSPPGSLIDPNMPALPFPPPVGIQRHQSPSQLSRRLSATSAQSTEDTHAYPASSTAATSAIMESLDDDAKLKEARPMPAPASSTKPLPQQMTLQDLIEREVAEAEAAQMSNVEHEQVERAGARRLRSILSTAPSALFQEENSAGGPSSIKRQRVSELRANSPGLIPALFDIPGSLEPSQRIKEPIPIDFGNRDPISPQQSLNSIGTASYSTSVRSNTPINGSQRLKTHRFIDPSEIENLYRSIRQNRSQLKRLNNDFLKEKSRVVKEMEDGLDGKVCGWIIVGKGVGLIKGVQMIDGMTRDDVNWDSLGKTTGIGGNSKFWFLYGILVVICSILVVPISLLAMAGSEEISRYSTMFVKLKEISGLPLGLVSITIPSIVLLVVFFTALYLISYLAHHHSGLPSKAASQLLSLKASLILICGCFIGWFTLSGSIINSIFQIQTRTGILNQMANSIAIVADFFFGFECLSVILIPAVVLGQPKRWKMVRDALNRTQTPRQRVLSLWPDGMNAILSRGTALMIASILVVFSPIAPLTLVPSLLFFTFIILVQQRNIRSMYRRGSQTGGKTELAMVTMLSFAVALQSGLIGLILLSRERWALGALAYLVTLGIVFISTVMIRRESVQKGRKSLRDDSKLALELFETGPNSSSSSSSKTQSKGKEFEIELRENPNTRNSMNSVLKLVNSALERPTIRVNRAVPLPSETVDDLVDTRLALRTYPDAPPHLPDLPWSESDVFSREMLYPPVLLQTTPPVWLPKDGVAEEEASDMRKYWNLEAFHEEGITTDKLNLY